MRRREIEPINSNNKFQGISSSSAKSKQPQTPLSAGSNRSVSPTSSSSPNSPIIVKRIPSNDFDNGNEYGSSGYQSNDLYNNSSQIKHSSKRTGSYQSVTPQSPSTQQHLGSIQPNFYQQARLQQQQQQGNWIYQVITEMLTYVYSTFTQLTIDNVVGGRRKNGEQQDFPEAQLVLDAATQQALENFRQYATIQYSKENIEHERDLMQLWKLCMPNVELSNRISQQWKELGFQGSDPATDFRGGGVFSLRNILYFAKVYPQQFQKMFKHCQHAPNAYPFVIASLNVTMMLFEIMGYGISSHKSHNLAAKKRMIRLVCDEGENYWGLHLHNKPKKHKVDNDDNDDEHEKKHHKTVEGTLLDFGDGPSSSEPKQPAQAEQEVKQQQQEKKKKKTVKSSSKQASAAAQNGAKAKYNIAFEEVYCCAFRILDKEWYAKNSTYFNFPTILSATRTRMEDLLELQFNNVEDVKQYNKEKRT